MRTRLLTVLAATVMAAAALSASTAPADAASYVKVLRWKDGDSLVTSKGEVRLIGVDTPEMGRCGSRAAKARAQRLAPAGSRIRLLNPSSVQDTDRYGRKLRYVVVGRTDVGFRQIKAGAKARYDGRDGYDAHPRQHSYRRADHTTRDYRCAKSSKPKGGGGSFAPVSRDSCPSWAPIKGNADSMIYHRPGQAYYDVTNPEECFKTAAAAEAAGYRAAKV